MHGCPAPTFAGDRYQRGPGDSVFATRCREAGKRPAILGLGVAARGQHALPAKNQSVERTTRKPRLLLKFAGSFLLR